MTAPLFRVSFCWGAFALGLSLTFSDSAQAWGEVGHETVAHIAADNLTPNTRQAVQELLGEGVTLASVSNWADEVRRARRDTGHWHYVNIERDTRVVGQSLQPYCKAHDCIVDQIDAEVATLKGDAPSVEKRRALLFLVHFVGDLHQPLHCADDGDKGGNYKWIRVPNPSGKRGRVLNLHEYWDQLLQVKAQEEPRALASALASQITSETRGAWTRGTVASWAWESFLVAHEAIYQPFEPGPMRSKKEALPLPRAYEGQGMRRIVDVQLKRAGVRLAFLLNRAFEKNADGEKRKPTGPAPTLAAPKR